MAGARDKRTFPRLPVELTGHCLVGNRFLRNGIANLSLGGLLLRTNEGARQGLPVRVAVALPFPDGVRFCSVAGSVARLVRDPIGLLQGIGVAFERGAMNAPNRTLLTRFLSQLQHR
jgi:hypothetical protein